MIFHQKKYYSHLITGFAAKLALNVYFHICGKSTTSKIAGGGLGGWASQFSKQPKHLTLWCTCISLVLGSTYVCVRVECHCQLEKPIKSLRPWWGSCLEERKRKVFPWWRVMDLPSRQINDFTPICPSWYLIAFALPAYKQPAPPHLN